MNYYYSIKGETKGPVDGGELDRLLAEGVITSKTPVIEVGGTEWSRYSVLRAGNSAVQVPPPPVDEKSFLEKLLSINTWMDGAMSKVFRMPSFVPQDDEGRLKIMEKMANLTGLVIWGSMIVGYTSMGAQAGGMGVLVGLVVGVLYGFIVQYLAYQLYSITNSLLIGQRVALSSARFPRLMSTLMIFATLAVAIATLVTAEGVGGILLALCAIFPCIAMVYLCMNAEGLLVDVNPAEVSPGREFNNSLKFILRAIFASVHLLTPILAVLAALSMVFLAFSVGGDASSADSMAMAYMSGGNGLETLLASAVSVLVLLHMPLITWLLLCISSWVLDLFDALFAMGSKKQG